jgi:hypothetical protein
VIGAVKLLADGADWWAFYTFALVSSTLLVENHVCAEEHDIFSFAQSQHAFFQNVLLL